MTKKQLLDGLKDWPDDTNIEIATAKGEDTYFWTLDALENYYTDEKESDQYFQDNICLLFCSQPSSVLSEIKREKR